MRRRQMYAQSEMSSPIVDNLKKIQARIVEYITLEALPKLTEKDTCHICGKKMTRGMAGHMRTHK